MRRGIALAAALLVTGIGFGPPGWAWAQETASDPAPAEARASPAPPPAAPPEVSAVSAAEQSANAPSTEPAQARAGIGEAPMASEPSQSEKAAETQGEAPAVSDTPPAPQATGVPPVRIEITPPEAAIGDVVELRVRAILPPGWKVELPALQKSLGELLVRDVQGPVDVASGKGAEKKIERTWTIHVQAFRTGEVEVPPIVLEARGPNGEKPEVRTGRQAVRVKSLLAAEGKQGKEGKEVKPADLDGPATIPFPWGWFWGLLAGFFLLVLAVGLLVRWLVLRKSRVAGRAKASGPPPLPPYDQALKELDELERSGLAEREELKEYYVRLTESLKRYLGWRFDFPAPERTTVEIRKELRARRASFSSGNPLHDEVTALLDTGDLVKFAKGRTERAESEAALASARKIVVGCPPLPVATAADSTAQTEERRGA